MPKIKTNRSKKYPKGWNLIEPTLLEFKQKMRDSKYYHLLHLKLLNQIIYRYFVVENEPIEGKRKPETLWPIFRIHHQMSRYIFDLFYKKKEISRELYEYCLNERWADAALVAKWKKSGFERLCCLQCVQKADS